LPDWPAYDHLQERRTMRFADVIETVVSDTERGAY
jgi:para-nitrobenzyl esterase